MAIYFAVTSRTKSSKPPITINNHPKPGTSKAPTKIIPNTSITV
jgi:hypothetical protein